MITIDKVVSADYYLEQVARDRHDYLVGDGEAPGYWAGSWAEQLGLSGEVTEDAFRSLLAERHPETGERLKRFANTTVRGWDMTFSPPKSVSALWAFASPETAAEIEAAQATAVKAGIGEFERWACVARLGKAGSDRQVAAGFAAAVYVHRLSREGDPQLHSHAVSANVVEAKDGRRAALDGTLLFRQRFAIDSAYQAALRAELTRRLGVQWVDRNGVQEIDGVPARICRMWSKRRAQIETKLSEWGTSGGRAAQAAALATRKAKVGCEESGNLRERMRLEVLQAGCFPDDLEREIVDLEPSRVPDQTLSDEQIVDLLAGPEGLTKQASGFGRRDVVAAIGPYVSASSADEAIVRINALADHVLRDPRVVPLLDPARRTSGEVIRPRDADGRVLREVCTEAEQRYTTVSLLAAEQELVERAMDRQGKDVAVVSEPLVDQALAEIPTLDEDQRAMVRRLCASGNGVDVVIGKAGTGKSTALRATRRAFDLAGVSVVGVAPTASAAHQLGKAAGIEACTVDRLLTELEHGSRTLAAGVVVIHDEAGMCSTRNRLALQRAVDEAGGKIADVGDHRQVPSVDVGGAHAVLAHHLGATVLGQDHRFRDQRLRDAAELVRDGQADQAVALLRELGMVTEAEHAADLWRTMVSDWLELREHGSDVRMLATENSVVGVLNATARAALVQRGEVDRRGRTYVSDDESREIDLAAGDKVRLGQNMSRLLQPDGDPVTVRNGMEGTVVRAGRRAVRVRLNANHADDRTEITLPAGYVGSHVDHGYAITADKAQGLTVDHVLFAPSAATSQERAYVALSRGRESNHIYARTNSGWQEAITTPGGHVFASEQKPDVSSDVASRLLAMHRRDPDPPPTRERRRSRGIAM